MGLLSEEQSHYCEGRACLRPGSGFFRPRSRPARDLGVLLARRLAHEGPLRVLDLMAGCGIRSIRYGLEAGACGLWVNDADPGRLPLLRDNLRSLREQLALTCTNLDARRLLAVLMHRGLRFSLVDLDAFGCPSGLIPLTLETLTPEGVLYLTSSGGRSATGHDRLSALRRYGAAVRVHPASWELALRLQLGIVARSAWAMGRGILPLFSFSDGRTFRTAVRLSRSLQEGEESLLGLVAHCPICGDQQVRSLLRLRRWAACLCMEPGGGELSPAVSGPLWIGPLQSPCFLEAMRKDAHTLPGSLSPAASRLLVRLEEDPGSVACCWPLAQIGRRLRRGPPSLASLVDALRCRGHQASVSAILPGQVRSDAPWATILATASSLGRAEGAEASDR